MAVEEREDAPVLVRVTRGQVVESAHRGHIAVVDESGQVARAVGDPGHVTFFRSAAKPIQAVAVVEAGAAEDLSPAEIAVMAGSHAGEDFHMAAVRGILEKAGLPESALACGSHPPVDRRTAEGLARAGLPPSPRHNNCSGKHAGMLKLAVHMGWPTGGYFAPEHPVQKLMRQVVAEFCGLEPAQVKLATDGCGVCVFAVPLKNMALAFARLACPDLLEPARAAAARRVVQAMQAHPEMISGTEGFCTALLRTCAGTVVNKAGAEGVYCVGLPRARLGAAVKVEDGGARGVAVTVVELLWQLGVLGDGELAKLEKWWRVCVRNWRGEECGEVTPAFRIE